jgi:2-dehydro-3-deoxyphosphogluconate aldolase/(4S)-4-hydroxy-2-oxoglutarate aldolase
VNATSLRNGSVAQAIRTNRLVAILRRIEPRERLLSLVEELAEAGIRVFEVTLDAPSGVDELVAVRERLSGLTGAFVGAGTLLRREQVDDAVRAGADFGVAPVFDRVVTSAALDAGLPFVPAGMTPTEIATAWDAGATFVKLFPASAVGPAFVRELRGPMPEVALIPTGGVDAENAVAFLSAGAAAVGIGGALTRADGPTRRAFVSSVLAETAG